MTRCRTALLVIAACCAACAAPADARRDSSRASTTAVVPPAPPPLPAWEPGPLPSATAAAADPAAAMARYLAFTSFRGAPEQPDSLAECPPLADADGAEDGWEPDAWVGFVRPTVLDVTPSAEDSTGRSMTARVALVRVVSIGRGASGFEGTIEAVPDTLTFTLQRAPLGWTVCGPVTKGAGVGTLTFAVTWADLRRTELNETRWRPAGTTWEAVARHADSLAGGSAKGKE